jgi:hypothetical protein
MNKRFRRMASSDITAVIGDLDRWAAGQLGSKLTWALLEERFGFSRQSLQAKPEIKAAYDLAKQALSGGLVKSRQQSSEESDELLREVGRLKLEIAEYQRKEGLWKQRWQRIAYHIRAKGIQMHDVDKATQGQDGLPTEREVSNILRPFDKEIPSSGRV